jgi:hypothetical protein
VVGFVGSQNRLVFFLQKFWQIEFVKLPRLRWLCRFSSKVRFPKISALVRLWFRLAKSVFVPSVLVGYRFWLFVVLASPVFVIVKIKVVCKSWACLRCRLFSQRFWSAGRLANKACTRRVGFCAIYKHFSGFEFFLHLKPFPSPPTRG